MGIYRTLHDGSIVDHYFGSATLRCTAGGRLDKLCHELHREFPTLAMEWKRARWYWRFLHWVVLIVSFGGNREFNDRYTTTIGMLIGWSDKKWKVIQLLLTENMPQAKRTYLEDRVWSTIQHEREHLRQFRRYSVPVMFLLYVFVFLPIGLAYFRARFERVGFAMTLRCWFVLDRKWAENPEARKWWISRFTGGAYAWAWPFKTRIGKWFDDELKRLQASEQVTFS